MIIILSKYPVFNANTGNIKINPPIIPLINESITILVDKDVAYFCRFILQLNAEIKYMLTTFYL
jgi:uncharacterized membrane protein YGL010W